jgi:myo-inositol-1(or 4)-monophosphatase
MYSEMLTQAMKQVRSTGAWILEQQSMLSGIDVHDKGLNQLVSRVDREAEQQLAEALGRLLPGAGFITEEDTVAQARDREYTWIIDPLDGTTNFLHGLPLFSVSVALARGNELLLGIVDVPALNECFTALRGGGAWLNGSPIRVSERDSLSASLLATGFPYTEFTQLPAYLEVLHRFMKDTRGLRRMGSAAIDLAYTACGRFDGFFETGLAPWDVAAGILLVQEAGGKVSDFRGGDDMLFGKEIIAGNMSVHTAMQTCIQHYFRHESGN